MAIEASDLTLVRGDLRVAADAIRLSRATLRTIKTNLAWAFGYNVAALPLAAAGLLNPMIAGAAMAASSVLVVTNSLRLRRFEAVVTDLTVVPAPLLAHWAYLDRREPRPSSPCSARRPADRRRGRPPTAAPGPAGTAPCTRVTGIADPAGSAVVSVPPGYDERARALVTGGGDLDELRAALPVAAGPAGPLRLPRRLPVGGRRAGCRRAARRRRVAAGRATRGCRAG